MPSWRNWLVPSTPKWSVSATRTPPKSTGAALAWDSERPNELWLGRRDSPNEVLTRDPALMHAAVRRFADYPGGHNEGFPDSFKMLFRAFYEYVEAGDMAAPRPFPTFADGHREILLCEAILRSHCERRWVKVVA